MKLKDEQGSEWESGGGETEKKLLANEGNGKPIILRTFDFDLPPGMDMPSDEQILEAHKQRLTIYLWKDELVPIMEYKVVKDNKKHSFRIFATCQAKAGSVILEKPQLLQDAIRPNPASQS